MRVLLIEDDPSTAEFITFVLKKEQFSVDVALDGDAGFEKAKSTVYRLIILDLTLPKRHGYDVLGQIRGLGVKTPVLILSNQKNVEDAVKALNMGADDYVIKGFPPELLVARCKAVMRRSVGQRRNIIRYRDLVINQDNMTVYRSGKNIMLAKKELGILMALLHNKGRVLSREEIFQQVWSEKGLPVNSNTIDVHIRMLRAKIDKPFKDKNIIKTVRGFGYAITE